MNASSLHADRGHGSFPVANAARRLLRVLTSGFLISSGYRALDCVRAPEGLQFPMSERARRLVRCGRLSAW